MRIGAGRRLRKFFNRELTDEMIWEEIIHEKQLNNLVQLKSLSQEAATAIACYRGYKLGFQGLKKASLEIMKGFSSYKGILMMDTLEEIEINKKNILAAERIFRHFKAGKLCFNSILYPSFHVLRALSKCQGQLELNGISELPPTKAAVLVSHKGNGIKLKGLSKISTPLARILVKYKGYMDISSVKNVEDEVLKLLASREEGHFFLDSHIRKSINEYKKNLALGKRKKSKKRSISLLAEFEKFELFDLKTTQTMQKGRKIEAVIETVDMTKEDADKREARLNFEISTKKNRLNELLRKSLENLSEEENKEVATLWERTNELKEEIKKILDLLIEEKEVGTVVFNSNKDLIEYLKDLGAADDENNALERIDDFVFCEEAS